MEHAPHHLQPPTHGATFGNNPSKKAFFPPLDPNPILKLLTAQTGLAQSCTLGCTGRTGSAGGTEEFSQPLVAEQEPSCSHPL